MTEKMGMSAGRGEGHGEHGWRSAKLHVIEFRPTIGGLNLFGPWRCKKCYESHEKAADFSADCMAPVYD